MGSARLPLVISCDGGTPVARLAGEIAAVLGDLGVAEAADDVDQVVAAARAGRRVIALDGCASACRAGLLEAKGLRPLAAFNLAELGVGAQALAEADPLRLAAEAAARLRARPTSTRRTRPPRPARPALTPRPKRGHVADDYLLAIDALASTTVECGALAEDAPTLAAHVSRLLAVSRASAGEMLGRLEASGLIERSARKQLLLTAAGRAAADRAVRRHRLLERFVGDYLDYSIASCYERARLLAGAFDDEAIERLRRALGDPARCPHGWPIDPHRAREESRELTALSALAADEQATVVRLAEHDGPVLDYLSELGLTPGTKLTAGRRGAGAGITVHIDGTGQPLAAVAAANVFVRREA